MDIILELAVRFDERRVHHSQISSEWQTPGKSGGLKAMKQGGSL